MNPGGAINVPSQLSENDSRFCSDKEKANRLLLALASRFLKILPLNLPLHRLELRHRPRHAP
jgi:hypothetical protein